MELRNLLYGFEYTATRGLSDIDVNELAYRPEDAKESCAHVLLKGIKNDTKKEDAIAAAKADPRVASALEGKQIVKEIYIPAKIVNIVAK